jgi:hypothetical protein
MATREIIRTIRGGENEIVGKTEITAPADFEYKETLDSQKAPLGVCTLRSPFIGADLSLLTCWSDKAVTIDFLKSDDSSIASVVLEADEDYTYYTGIPGMDNPLEDDTVAKIEITKTDPDTDANVSIEVLFDPKITA